MGFYTLILLAGLQAIPKDMYEAAQLDAASPWRTLRRITLPLLMPNLIVVLVLALIRAVQIFDEVFVLHRRRAGLSHHLHRAVHLPDRLCRADSPLRTGGGGLLAAGAGPGRR